MVTRLHRLACGAGLVLVLLALPTLAFARSTPSRASWTGPVAVSRCPARELHLPAETEAAMEAVLLIRSGEFIGSAVLISPDGFALTAAHVVSDAKSKDDVEVVTHSGIVFPVTVLRVDEYQDVALLKLHSRVEVACLAPADQRTPLGGDIFVLGSPGGAELSFSVAKGIVSGYREFEGRRFVQLDASINPGNSGGPVVDENGYVVALASWKVSHVSMEGLAFAVPIATAIESLDIELADQSDLDWAAKDGRRPASKDSTKSASSNKTTDAPPRAEGPTKPSAKQKPTRSTSIDDKARKRREQSRRLITAGTLLAGLGVVGVGTTGVLYFTVDPMRKISWQMMVVGNTAGWVMLGVGAPVLTSGLILRRKSKVEAKVSITPAGVTIGGRF